MQEVRHPAVAEPATVAASVDERSDLYVPREGGSTLVVAGKVASSHRQFLTELDDAFAVCEVNERRALELVMQNLKPAFLIVDLSLPGLGRVRGVREVRRFSPDTRIIALTDSPTNDEGLLALKGGARGYCPSSIASGDIRKAILVIARGEIWASRELVREMVSELVSIADRLAREGSEVPAHSRLESLTKRQRVVAKLISSGASNKEIGNRLNISERTVKAHLTEAFRAVGVTDRLGLALLFQAHPTARGSD